MKDCGVTPDDVYTHGHHESVLRSHTTRTVANSAAYLVPHLYDGAIVLDVGCGPGTITVDMAARVGSGRVVGIDRSADVIEHATRDADERANVRFETGDVYALPFDAESFDVVHAHQVLQHLSDPISALREMKRVCKRGGVVGVRDADYASFAWAPLDPRLDDWLDTYRSVARANSAEPDAGRHLLAWARAVGFRDIRASASAWCFATDSERTWWGELWADRMRHSSVADRALELGLASREQLEQQAEAFEAWAAHPDGWFALLHGEVIATK
jgi:ubiquinone/menaquinone biosynthesis C-methylase UbiE